jgi:hypothetical protein
MAQTHGSSKDATQGHADDGYFPLCPVAHLGTVAQHDSHPAASANAEGLQMSCQAQDVVVQLPIGADVGTVLWVGCCSAEAVNQCQALCIVLLGMHQDLPSIKVCC